MKILLVGSGAREHAIAWALSKSPQAPVLFAIPGNAGIGHIAKDSGGRLYPGDVMDKAAVVAAARDCGADLVFVGPDDPLGAGLADETRGAGFPTVGPGIAGARLESSKAFSKEFCLDHGIPVAASRTFAPGQEGDLADYLEEFSGRRVVVKKSGLAAGKGVLETADLAEARAFALGHLKTDQVLVEEFLSGWEISIFALTDGRDWKLLPPASDYKKAREGDTGPNTGGMGSICPNPRVTPELMERINAEIIEPSFAGIKAEGIDYRGILYFGLMITERGPYLIEYNCRFGDPETQVVLPLIESDFVALSWAMASGGIADCELRVAPGAACGVVVAAQGYPGAYRKGLEVEPIEAPKGVMVFHATTSQKGSGPVLTGGGRCFTVVARGADLAEAKKRAYAGLASVRFEGAWHRNDIGDKYLGGK
jgi:phosphoribosylamine---glycine ligase